jgi:hypothetical protein
VAESETEAGAGSVMKVDWLCFVLFRFCWRRTRCGFLIFQTRPDLVAPSTKTGADTGAGIWAEAEAGAEAEAEAGIWAEAEAEAEAGGGTGLSAFHESPKSKYPLFETLINSAGGAFDGVMRYHKPSRFL